MSLQDECSSPFETPRAAALALLAVSDRWSRRTAGFLGHITVAQEPLTDKQQTWLESLLKKAGLPPLVDLSER